MKNENEVFKKIDVTTKIDAKENSIVATNATFYSYDTNTSLIKMKLVKEGQPMSLPVGTEVLLTAVKINKDKNKLVFSPQIKDRTQGLIEWIIPQQLRGYIGSLRIGVFIKLPNNQRLHGGYFSVSMDISDIDSDNGWTEIYWQSWDNFQSQAEAEWENWKSQQITKQSKFESDTNVYLNRIETKVDAAQADLTLLKEEMHLSEAWSNSSDGLVDFSKVKANTNLFEKSKIVNLALNLVTITISTSAAYRGWYLPVKPGEIYSISRIEPFSNRFSYAFTSSVPSDGVSYFGGNFPNTVNNVSNIVIPANANYLFICLSLIGEDTSKMNVKVERGSIITPYTTAPSERDEKGFLKYYGLALTDSNAPTDYVWVESPEYTRYKAHLDTEDSQIAWSSGQQITKRHLIDFKGKVPGSTVENCNIVKYSTTLTPSTSGKEVIQSNYNNISTLDGTSWNIAIADDQKRINAIFSFNLVEQVNRDYPGLFESVGADNLAKQVAFLRKVTTRMLPSVWGYGSSPTGNLLSMKVWNTTAWSTSSATNATNSVKEISFIWGSSSATQFLQDDGFVYILAYGDPSDGTTPSVVNIDYASLEYTLSFKKSDFDTVTKKEIGEIKEWIAAHS